MRKSKWVLNTFCPGCEKYDVPVEHLVAKDGGWYFVCQVCGTDFENEKISKELLREKDIHITSDIYDCWCDYVVEV